MTSFATVILNWFRENGRALPWRDTTDPYPIWLSEIILQQTRISQGWEYWERFTKTYPTVEDLANATLDDVLKLWQGLGYYSRARNLHAAAKQIVALGHFPQTLEEIKSLKGVGDYTAAAIASFAFGNPAAVVDGNVYRVLSRYFGITTPINSTQGKKEFAALAQSLLPSDEAAAYNQGIMDFGAIQCTPQSPKCLLCPLAETCDALRTNRVSTLPVKEKTVKIQTRHLSYTYIRCHGEVALHRRERGDIWEGLWEPYCGVLDDKRCQLLARDVKHILTHRILLADFYLLETDHIPSLPSDYIWVKEEEIERYGVPRLIEKLITLVNASCHDTQKVSFPSES